MIKLVNLQKVVDQRTVLDIPELSISAGNVIAVIGTPGSGTEPLLQLLIGRTRPTAGTVRIANQDPTHDKNYFSREAGVLFAEESLYKTRSPRGNLGFYGRLHRLPRTRTNDVLKAVGLADHANAKLAALSPGMRRRLSFGIAIQHQPSVLILADPFARCDEASIGILKQLILQHAANNGTTLILADSDTYLVDICDAIYTLDQGRIVAERYPKEEQSESALPFKIPVKLEGRVVLLNPVDILYVVAEDGHIFLQTKAERLPAQFTLAELEQRLSRSGFFRAHRGYLVNLQHVTEVIPYTRSSFSLRLDDASRSLIPLSKDAARELRELLDY
ncbi:MAG: ATP-binding cassette domain-containing protein [Chloroflexi bacterium]|nr:ATP-binding cassette domain-containing protein [Chloroflexota bacterium]